MRILTLVHEFPPIGGGGGRAAYDICRELVKRGHDVTVLTAHINGLPYKATQDGVKLVRISSRRTEAFRASFITMLAYVVCGVWAGLKHIRNNRPNIIHGHFAVPSGALALMLSTLTKIPYILTAHLGDVPGGVPEKTDKWFRWLKPLTYPIWKRAKAVVAVSAYTRSLALRHYPVDIKVIPNGVGISQLTQSEIKINNPIQIVFAGRLMPQKNPLMIIQTLAKIKDLNWHCTMLGDGALFDNVKNEIEKNNLQTRFTLGGWVTPDDVLNQFSKSDILFMPSLSEGLPVVGVQALASGLAFVVSDIGGFMDLVEQEKNGYLIELTDEPSFASALRILITNPTQLITFRQASLEKAKKFDIQKIAYEYEQMMQEVLNGR
jgi:L-malate glycosyltransferase